MMHNKNVTCCPFGSLSFYLFYRFHISQDVWPDFSDPKHWYNIYVLPSAARSNRPMTYTQQYKTIKQAQSELGIQCSSKTQIGRKCGAAHAENSGANESSVDKNGHWATRSRSGAYTNNVIPWECVRVLAGFPPESKQFFLERALLDPPEELANQIFPLVDQGRQEIKDALDSGRRRTEIAGHSFLDLLQYMRTVILQDAAILFQMEDFKEHPIFQHPIFISNEFRTFALSLTEKIGHSDSPLSLLMHQALPLVTNHLEQISQQVINHTQSLSTLNTKIDCFSSNTTTELQKLKQHTIIQLHSALSQIGQNFISSANNMRIVNEEQNDRVNFMTDLCDDHNESTVHTLHEQHDMQYDYVNFKMNRNITTIYDAWKEWNYGSTTADNIFIPPLRDIEAQLGSKWRGGFSTVEGNFFFQEKIII
jgi:hypothetical protein